MAGSQLKQLKASLAAKGLVGQTNGKKGKKIAASDTRRDQAAKTRDLDEIRGEFNRFDTKVNRTKRDYTIVQGGAFVTAGKQQNNRSSRTNGGVEAAMRAEYEAEKKQRNRTGGMVDRRFGENNAKMTQEEKMLQRFTRERQLKSGAFSLGSDDEFGNDDDDANGGFTLTHSGRSLEFDSPLLGHLEEIPNYVDEDAVETGPARKKSKREVMAEIIAKSKFHRKERQKAFEKTQEEIMDLDEEFGDVVGALRGQRTARPAAIVPKSQQDIEYDAKMRELTYDRRSVPADRTKTDEEIAQEHREKMQRLEQDRINRMTALRGDEDGADADDLDDDFWAGSDDEEGQAIGEDGEEEDDEESGSQDEGSGESSGRPKSSRYQNAPVAKMPSNHAEFAEAVENMENSQVMDHIKTIGRVFHPRLAEGNKQKMDQFVAIIFEHILFLGQQSQPNAELIDDLIKLLRTMAEQYNELLVQTIRDIMKQVETRVVSQTVEKQDLVFFVALGYLFSASDHFHLVITPALILMNQFLSTCMAEEKTALPQRLGQGLVVCEILLRYQDFAKRFDPEVVRFVEKTLQWLLPEPTKISTTLSSGRPRGHLNLDKSFKPKAVQGSLSILLLFVDTKNSNQLKFELIARTVDVIDNCTSLWRDKSAAIEVLSSWQKLLQHTARYYGAFLPKLADNLSRHQKLLSNMQQSRKPLALQEHRKIAIKTFAPRFEENFNPDKKSYDPDRERQEVNKIKAQIKKEKKMGLKELRKQTRFGAIQQIEEKKQMYSDYHRKMANIVNSISTVEGAEKNQYEREKKRRQNQK
ncbi:hypothetical protein PUMCH_005154 [Australozyma saopauloensis]|uniref:Nucleolar complex protein 14 n=1 Tax=Australozyma saopauloensis TaxID=291208 RepID=A0AAX4HH56_9ASCO|nr:hypothetical protein PUMCH_005154 [[Candida] saopauloensis]